MEVAIGAGHGIEVLGKRSPDGKFREYAYCRRVAKEVVYRLKAKGVSAVELVPEETDVSLVERVRRVNALCSKFGARNVCYVSIHNNAAGDGSQWLHASGWEAWTSKGQTQGDKLADCLYDAAKDVLYGIFGPDSNIKIRKDMSDGDPDKESNFYVLAKSNCAACLTENFFMDNKVDVAWLESSTGFDAIVRIHVDGIMEYIKKYG